MKKTIFVVSPIPVFPATGGNRARIKNLLRWIMDQGHEVHYALLSSRRMGDCNIAEHEATFDGNFTILRRSRLGETLYLLRRSIFGGWRMLAKRAGLVKRRLGSVDDIYYSDFTRQLRDMVHKIQPDIFIVEYVYFSKAFAAAGENVLKIIDTHDAFSREVGEAEEARGLRRADIILAIQDTEADHFRSILQEDGSKVVVVSHILERRKMLLQFSAPSATFFGSNFVDNVRAIRYFIYEVMPHVIAAQPDFILYVAGSICDMIEDHPSIRKLGRVPDISDAFRDAPILINPILSGTGVKIKLLEAWSLGIPTVSTQRGVLGIAEDMLSGVIIVPDGDAYSFAKALVSLTADKTTRDKLGRHAHAASIRWNEQQVFMLSQQLS